MGINPIAYSEMKVFFDLICVYPVPEEIMLLELLDNIAVQHHSKKQAEQSKQKPAPKSGKR